jgi:hypothetical protein
MVARYYGRVVGSERDQPLDELRWHWGSAYLIEHHSPDVWIAQRQDNRETLRADSPGGLLDRIRADYAAHPVSRRIAGMDYRPETPGCRFLPEG